MPRRIAIVAGRPNETNDDVVRAWQSAGLDAVVLSGERALEYLAPGDTAIGRIDVRRSLDGPDSGLAELAELGRRGVTVLNPPRALLRTHDKLLTAGCLVAAGVPHPATEHVAGGRGVRGLRPPPFVVKPRFGSWGSDVFRCDSWAALRGTLREIADRPWYQAQGALVQALVPPAGYDLRVLVAGGQVIGAEERVSAPGEWRTNISLGGTFRRAVAPLRARELALAAALAVSADVVGVDLLPWGDDYTVIEVNGAIDFDAAYALPGRDIFVDLADALGLREEAASAAGALSRRVPAVAALAQ